VTKPDASLLRAAAAAAAGHQQYPAGALYIVATPIGNLADISLRALHVLAIADAIACEDTRQTALLLQRLGLEHRPLVALHRHNEQTATDAVLARLAAGARVACVSDAGTPGINDPGARLVARAHAAGVRVVPVPGVSAATAIVSVAGLADGPWTFCGFLPSKGAERRTALAAALAAPGAVVLFEAPHRIEALARELAQAAGARAVTVGRELTKQFESVATVTAAAMPAWLAADADRRRGEFVLVVHAGGTAADTETLPDSVAGALERLAGVLPTREAAALVADLTGLPRNRLYAAALAARAGARTADGSHPAHDREADPDADGEPPT
jgi:16S rRNA (cytidine1402-2'-O)-methyltransferase